MSRNLKVLKQNVFKLDYRVLFEQTPGLYLVLELDLTILTASDLYLRATKTKKNQIVGRNLFEVFPDNPNESNPSGVSNLRASLEKVLKEKVEDSMAIQKYDIPIPENEGGGFEIRYWSPTNSPIFDDKGKLIYILHSVKDVTDFFKVKDAEEVRKNEFQEFKQNAKFEVYLKGQQLQDVNKKLRLAHIKELKEMNTALLAANRDLDHFTHLAAHDLREPARRIYILSEILGNRIKSILPNVEVKEVTEILGMIRAQSNALLELVADFRVLTHLDTHQELSRVEINLNDLIQKILEGFQDELQQKQVKVKFQNLPTIRVYKNLLGSLYRCIIEYCISYGSVNMELEFTSIVSDRGYTLGIHSQGFVVPLSGEGDPFDPNEKISSYFRSGIGLKVAKRIVERHQGKIWAETIGNSLHFKFDLGESLK